MVVMCYCDWSPFSVDVVHQRGVTVVEGSLPHIGRSILPSV